MPNLEKSSTAARIDTYVLGYDSNIVEKISQRIVSREGAFALPFLRKGMTLLDAGCGPGSITIGLAQAVAPGVVTGIDIDAGQIAISQAAVEQLGVGNTRFLTADVYRLPFEDQSFDAIFCHTLFMHLSLPEVALRELFRVCKPGGFIAIREGLGMFDRLSTVTVNGAERSFSDFMRDLGPLEDGDLDIGLRLKGLLATAGFCRTKPGTYNEIYHEPMDLVLLESWFRSLLEGKLGERAIESALMTRVELDDAIARMRTWPSDPEALCVVSWIEYVSWKPEMITP